MHVLIAYATRHGSTLETAEFIADILRDAGHTVTVEHADEVTDITPFDAFVLGTGIYRGTWLPALTTFIRRFEDDFEDKPVFAWMLCIRLLEDDGRPYVLENYVPHYLLHNLNMQGIQPFLGRLYQVAVDMNERWTLSLRYDGSLDPTQIDADYRNWDAIQGWAESIVTQLETLASA
jgi:menaquinone-dependent protoporphyrinogen oxidase